MLAVDAGGREQVLLAAFRSPALAGALEGPTAGRPMRRLLDGLRVHRVAVPDGSCLDVDDDAGLRRARATLAAWGRGPRSPGSGGG